MIKLLLINIIYFILNKYKVREWVYNKIYFHYFVFINNIKHSYSIHNVKNFSTEGKILKKYINSRGLQHSPLLKVKKLLKEINNKKDYHFIDVGSGLGILLIYISINYNFISYNGVEINKKFIKDSLENLKKNKHKNKKLITIKNISAEKIILDKNKRYAIYLYNPFNELVLYKFLQKNHKNIKKNQSIILYVSNKKEIVFEKFNLKKNFIGHGLIVYS
jgi:hypothetical protein